MAEYRSQIRAELVFAEMNRLADISETTPVCFQHLWLGVTVEDQVRARERIPDLLRCPAAVRFISIEPMLEDIPLKRHRLAQVDWVIVGAESGAGRRLCRLSWIRRVVEQCRDWGVPVFVKQIHDAEGRLVRDIEKFPNDLQVREYPQETPR